jgi:diacylglycerol kinase family enzyme
MKDQQHVLYLFNSKSDGGKAVGRWKKACRDFPFLPKKPTDITEIGDLVAFLGERSPEIVAIAGGDGTINSVCRAVLQLKQKPVLAILPFGFGNALSFCLGVEKIEKAVEVLQKQPRRVTIDVLKTNINDHDLGVFNIGVGFDASIVHNRINYRYIGLRSYVLSALRSYVFHPEKEMHFTIDHTVTLHATASSLVIANCPILGQNLVVSPSAKLNDGFLDCTLFSSKYAYLTNLRLRGFKNPLYSERGKVRFKAKHIRVEGEPFVQVDGDPAVQGDGLEVAIVPNQLTFLRNKKDSIDLLYEPFII